jgi:hypothetical protein
VEAAARETSAMKAAAMESAAMETTRPGESRGRESKRRSRNACRNSCGFQNTNRARHLEFSSDFEFQIRAFAR